MYKRQNIYSSNTLALVKKQVGTIALQTLFSTFSKKQTINGSGYFSGAWADQNGNSLSMNYAGTRAVIASGWGSGGNVYIYHKDSSGTWSLDTTLTAPSSISNFGHGVDMSSDGNRIFVIRGVYNTDAAGRIFVYDYSSGWSNTPSTTLSEPSRGNGFARRGYCSPDGNTCGLVSTGGNDRVYTWKYSGGSWQTTPDYIETPSEGEVFGCGFSFNTDGTRMLVGARLSDEGGTDIGRAYICDYSSGWTISHDLAGQYAGENFGEYVRINAAGTRAVIGARYNDEGGTDRGRVYIWDRNSGTGNWSLTQDIASTVVSNNGDFGGDLFMNKEGDRVIIGASRDDTVGTDRGSVHVYDRQSNGQFTLVQTMNGESDSERFGFSIGSDEYGNYILIGAPTYNSSTGRVFFYQSSVSAPPSLTFDGYNKLTAPVLEASFTATRLSDWDNNNQSKTEQSGVGDWPDSTTGMTHWWTLHNNDKCYTNSFDTNSRDTAQLFTTVNSGDWNHTAHTANVGGAGWASTYWKNGYKFSAGSRALSSMKLSQPPSNHETGDVIIKYWDGTTMKTVSNQSPTTFSAKTHNLEEEFTFDVVSSQYWMIECKAHSNTTSASKVALHAWQLLSGRDPVSTVLTKGSDSYDIGTASSIYLSLIHI